MVTARQIDLDLAGRPTARVILDRIRSESRDESEKGRWFEQLFMRIARQQPEFEVDEIWRWPEWPEREALTGLDGRDMRKCRWALWDIRAGTAGTSPPRG